MPARHAPPSHQRPVPTGSLMRACLPAASTPRCQKDLSWARLAPRAAALSATTEIGFSGPFFTRRRKIGSRLAAAAILSQSARRSRLSDLLLCSSGLLMRGTAATCSRVAVPTAADARSGKAAGHFRLQELQSVARVPRGDSGSTRRIAACPASRGKRGPQPGRIPGPGVIPEGGYGRARTGAVCARDGPRRGAAGSGLPGRRWRGAFAGTGSGQRCAAAESSTRRPRGNSGCAPLRPSPVPGETAAGAP